MRNNPHFFPVKLNQGLGGEPMTLTRGEWMEYNEGTSYKGFVRVEGDQQRLGKQGAVCILRHEATRERRGFVEEVSGILGEGHLMGVVILEEQHHRQRVGDFPLPASSLFLLWMLHIGHSSQELESKEVQFHQSTAISFWEHCLWEHILREDGE